MPAIPAPRGSASPMVHLRTVPDAFHARVIAARLGADGILTELRGAVGGPYPIGSVSVWVSVDDQAIASELLLVDELEAAFEEMPEGWETSRRRPVLFGWTTRQLLAAVALVLMVSAIMAGRLLT